MNAYNIIIYTEDSINILGRIAQIFSRKLLIIEHLSMSSLNNLRTFILVVKANKEDVEHVEKILKKQIEIFDVDYTKIAVTQFKSKK